MASGGMSAKNLGGPSPTGEDSSESDGETEPAKSFHRRLSTNREINSSASIKEGYLLKQTWSFQRWRRRYFKLKGRKLYYAKDTKNNQKSWFLQDGAASHTVRASNDAMRGLFSGGIIFQREDTLHSIREDLHDLVTTQVETDMLLKATYLLLVALAVSAKDEPHEDSNSITNTEAEPVAYRLKRSLQPGAPNVNNGNKQPWELNPNIERDDRGNTKTDVNIKHHGDDHDFDAGWSKVVRGPNKAKPSWHVGGTYRWRRSPEDSDEEDKDEPWQLDPSLGRGEDGNTNANINLKRHGENHDIDASWSKVVDGPNKGKPTWHVGGSFRFKRSLQPGAPNVNNGNKQPWELNPNIERDDRGNTKTDVNIKHHGDDHDFDAGWSKVVRGPNKAKPSWHVGGTYRWRRSPEDSDEEDEDEPWQLDPSLGRGEDGNTNAIINLKRHGENHDIDASWSKVVDGPNRGKPTWHVGGSFRFKRSLQPGAPNVDNGNKQPWELNPNIERDDRGNTKTDVNIKHHGDDHDFEAGWSKVVRGPNKAKPSWHVGGTYRWRRSSEDSDEEDKDEPWQLDPSLGRGEDGNTNANINLKRHGENHDIDASWSKVVDGPNRGKPTWHVGGSFRFKRSLQPGAPNVNNGNKQPWELNPNIERDNKGNTKTDVNIKHHGDDHDFDAGWSKVVRGPNKAKPSWHVGGTYRWRRSPEDSDEEDEDEPWQLDPSLGRGEDGNTNANINLKRHGENHDIDASWSKVVDGPNKGKPTWHVGGSFRFKRSLQPGAPNVNNGNKQSWELNPNIERDDSGNTKTDVNIKHHGDDHDFDAGWSKVVRGPNKAKPSWHVGGTYRWRRSPEDSDEEDEDEPWQLDPSLGRGEDGNTNANINLKRHGENHDIDASWSKVVDGPNRGKPTWHVGGSFRFKRSLQPGAPNVNSGNKQPWELNPNIERDNKGNTKTDVNIKHHGDDHDFDAGWSKVVRGPNKAKPSWHVGGTYRWRRSPEDSDEEDKDEPWQLDPSLGRGEDGNTNANINLKRHGENHDIDASWSKVVDGPNKGKPTWHVGGSFRFKRSLQPGAPNVNNGNKQPWELNPNIERDDRGNTKTDVNIKHHGDDHDFDAGWSKVVRGPNKAKPSWHVGGTYRWRRSTENSENDDQ